MKLDSLKQFKALRASLQQEKTTLEARLKEINEVLGEAPKPAAAGSGVRAENTLSLRQAISKAVAQQPLTKLEILDAIDKLGYRFTARDPMNSLNTMLYTPGNFKKHPGGKWGPLKK